MSNVKRNDVREPLVHLSKRASIDPVKAWAIRLIAIVLGLIICGLVAFLLIEKLNQNPGRIGDFYEAFIRGSFSTMKEILLNVMPVTTAEYGASAAARPFNSRLDKSKLTANGFTPLPEWQDALHRYLQEIEVIR